MLCFLDFFTQPIEVGKGKLKTNYTHHVGGFFIMKEIVVYITADYSANESIYVNDDLSRDEIIEIVNDNFETWYSFDII